MTISEKGESSTLRAKLKLIVQVHNSFFIFLILNERIYCLSSLTIWNLRYLLHFIINIMQQHISIKLVIINRTSFKSFSNFKSNVLLIQPFN